MVSTTTLLVMVYFVVNGYHPQDFSYFHQGENFVQHYQIL